MRVKMEFGVRLVIAIFALVGSQVVMPVHVVLQVVFPAFDGAAHSANVARFAVDHAASLQATLVRWLNRFGGQNFRLLLL